MFIELFEADREFFFFEFRQFIVQYIVVRIWVLVWVVTQEIEYIRFFNITPEILECFISIHSLFYISSLINIDICVHLKTKKTRKAVRNSCKNNTNRPVIICVNN